MPHKHIEQAPPDVDLQEVLLALRDVMHRADMFTSHQIAAEPLSVRERMSRVLETVSSDEFSLFTDLFDISRGAAGRGGDLHGGARADQAAADRAGAGRSVRADSRTRARRLSVTVSERAEKYPRGRAAGCRPAAVARCDCRPCSTRSSARTRKRLRAALQELTADYEGRGIEVAEVSSGWRIQVREACSPWVSRLWDERPARYSRALMETLALIAYRQPITRGEIEDIRGVSVSTNIVKTLMEREWVHVVGHRDVPGKPSLYGTTREFLDYFGLKSLDELPTLAELRDLDEINRELDLNDPDKAANQDTPDADAPDQVTGDAGRGDAEAGEIEADAGGEAQTADDRPAGDEPIQAEAEVGVPDQNSDMTETLTDAADTDTDTDTDPAAQVHDDRQASSAARESAAEHGAQHGNDDTAIESSQPVESTASAESNADGKHAAQPTPVAELESETPDGADTTAEAPAVVKRDEA